MHRILLVDDFKPWRDEARRILETQPELQVVAHAQDGEEAVQLAIDLKPHLVLLDIGLPKLNGLAAAARIFKVAPRMKIIFFSPDDDPDIVYAARNIGASAFVNKRKAATDLLRAIAETIAVQQREKIYVRPLCRLPAK